MATAVRCYDAEDIQEARISLQQEAHRSEYEFKLYHHTSLKWVWDIPYRNLDLDGSYGQIRCGITLPDPSKSGRLRYIMIHLVDPHYRICSPRNVPPRQQIGGRHRAAVEASRHPVSLLEEGIAMIERLKDDLSMGMAEALTIRSQTESEREDAMKSLWEQCCTEAHENHLVLATTDGTPSEYWQCPLDF
ncbi:uncharacterized protein BDW43DRAFT_309022 [Aspergillus alliaceus]|uniref:uncharacterized protein n=1 Tax=Petromyces alliaceus TaxID=209559 RepID=UPI0012A50B38|nr:uncharacterized protein BDW43DRAFT_309022 [Aspergillus alliaceus]KAB8235687.1 hypothetical protein BDW43DRAFT_309022 [Aspergillus alliaceus]